MYKLITPVLYFLVLFILTALSVWLEAVMRSIGILGEYYGVIDLPTFIFFLISIVLFGIPLFWLANLLIRKIENQSGSIINIHIRQSLLYYLLFLYCAGAWIAGGLGNTEEDGYLLIWMGISIIGILVNYKFQILKIAPVKS